MFSNPRCWYGKILNIAKYNNKKDYQNTNKWFQLLFAKMMKEFEGVVKSILV